MLTMDSIPNIIIKLENLFKVRHIKIIPFTKTKFNRITPKPTQKHAAHYIIFRFLLRNCVGAQP